MASSKRMSDSRVRKLVVLKSPTLGEKSYAEGEGVRRFSQWVDVPRSSTQNPVTVQVLDVQTSKAIKLLPAFEEPFMARVESCEDNSFDQVITNYAFVTINTANFNMSLSYEEMFNNSLVAINFEDPGWIDILDQYSEGEKWYQQLHKALFNQPKYFPTMDAFINFLVSVNRLYATVLSVNEDTEWYTQMRDTIGPMFMTSKRPSTYNKGTTFLQWLHYENYFLLEEMELEVKSNQPINNQLKVVNPSENHVRFVVPDIRNEHSMYTLFSTLPSIKPHSIGVSRGANFLPKEPFYKLQLHSNLCTRLSHTGRESAQLLSNIFTGDEEEGFVKQENIENLPLALNPGFQTISFEIKARGFSGELQYLHPETARTTVKLAFSW
jgi:hypothetical protein